ncbi:MAG: hypothetical protein V1736_04645, partial [Pseudomonadota bacterium]
DLLDPDREGEGADRAGLPLTSILSPQDGGEDVNSLIQQHTARTDVSDAMHDLWVKGSPSLGPTNSREIGPERNGLNFTD